VLLPPTCPQFMHKKQMRLPLVSFLALRLRPPPLIADPLRVGCCLSGRPLALFCLNRPASELRVVPGDELRLRLGPMATAVAGRKWQVSCQPPPCHHHRSSHCSFPPRLCPAGKWSRAACGRGRNCAGPACETRSAHGSNGRLLRGLRVEEHLLRPHAGDSNVPSAAVPHENGAQCFTHAVPPSNVATVGPAYLRR
jgi:hypothetical protein